MGKTGKGKTYHVYLAIFTDSALWAGSVIESQCVSVCLLVCVSVTKNVIVNCGQAVVFFSLIKIELINMDLGILNLEGHQSCMIGSKVTTILQALFILLIRSSELRCS